MLPVAPWVLGAVVLYLGTLFFFLADPTDDSAFPEVSPDLSAGIRARCQADASAAWVVGLALAVFALWILWIGPNPEPFSAWVVVELLVVAGVCTLVVGGSQTTVFSVGLPFLATGVLMALVFIVRATLPGFS